jgi:hypothetical protein
MGGWGLGRRGPGTGARTGVASPGRAGAEGGPGSVLLLGRRLDLRDVAGRVLAHWPDGQPGWGYVQGMYAFGLEENADYQQALARGQAALDHNPRDVWSVHAIAHVHEMRGAHRDGLAFLTATAPDWASSYFAGHNWWHRGLYHLELGETGRRWPCMTPGSGPAGPRNGWTSSTPPRCCGG